eukprot:SAG11_NODE_186_length_13142_cov_17.515679_6_plen_191_part_00
MSASPLATAVGTAVAMHTKFKHCHAAAAVVQHARAASCSRTQAFRQPSSDQASASPRTSAIMLGRLTPLARASAARASVQTAATTRGVAIRAATSGSADRLLPLAVAAARTSYVRAPWVAALAGGGTCWLALGGATTDVAKCWPMAHTEAAANPPPKQSAGAKAATVEAEVRDPTALLMRELARVVGHRA